jgi:hypothetical protein
MARNACVDAAVAALREAGVLHPVIVPGGKHLQVRWPHGDGMRFYALPSTPSDRNAPKITRAGIRRLLKRDGLIKAPPPAERPSPPPRPPTLAERVERLEQELAALKAAMPPAARA